MSSTRSRWVSGLCLGALALTTGVGAQQAQTPYAGHGAESVPREKVAKYAPTPLPGDVTRRIQMMLDVRGAVLGTLSPDGKRFFFTWGITGTPNVWRVDGPKSFPIQLTGGEDPTRLSGITPDGKYLVLGRDVGGQEDPGLYLQRADGGPLTEVHHKKGTRARYGFSTRDAKTIYFSANDIAPDSYAIYRYDIAAAKRELVFDQPGLWMIADHREGQGGALTLLLAKATGALSREFAEYDVATRTLTPLFGQNETVEYDAGYAPVTGELFVLTNKLGEFRRLYRWKRGEDLVPVTAEMPKDVSGFGIDDARRRLYYTVNDGGYERLRAIDATTLGELTLPVPQDADSVSVGTMTPDGRYATVGVETAKAPRSSYVFDWQTQTLTPWMLPSAPEIDLSKFAVAKLETLPGARRHEDPDVRALPGARARPRPIPPTPVPWSSNSTAARRARRRPASAATRSSSSTAGSSTSSRTCAAATVTARRGSTPTTGRSASTSSPTSRTPAKRFAAASRATARPPRWRSWAAATAATRRSSA